MRRRGGCRPRIVNSENLQCVDLQRLFRSELRRFQVEIGDFVTKRRSGFGRQTGGGGGQKKGCSRRAAECWFPPPTSCQSRSSVCPFRGSPKGPSRRLRGPRRGRTGTKGGVRRCRAAQAAPRSGDARQVRRRTRTPVRRDGRVFYRSTKATSKTHAAGRVLPFAVPLAWKPVVLAGRRKSGHASQVRRRAALSRSCARDGPKASKGWGV